MPVALFRRHKWCQHGAQVVTTSSTKEALAIPESSSTATTVGRVDFPAPSGPNPSASGDDVAPDSIHLPHSDVFASDVLRSSDIWEMSRLKIWEITKPGYYDGGSSGVRPHAISAAAALNFSGAGS
jgi:hypothetical protein